jgi:uncharacterized protein (DUF2267 family)
MRRCVVNHDEFIGQVQHRARLGSRGDAERATRATLETLAERMADGAAQNLAAQLPREIGEHLRRQAPQQTGTGNQFSVDDFFERVTEREGVDQPEAVLHARVVLEVTDEATTGSLMTKVREQFPAEFDRLFEAGSEGRMRRAN